MKKILSRLAGITFYVVITFSCNSVQEPEANTGSAPEDETTSPNSPTTHQETPPPVTSETQQQSATQRDSAVMQNTTSQQESSPTGNERWIITPNNLRGATGRLLLDFPPDMKWTLELWRMPQNESIETFYNTGSKTAHVITPGTYRVRLNGVNLMNVPVKKGHDTKIYWGVLDIVSETNWEVANHTGDTTYTNGYKPQKMPLPVGTYRLILGGQGQPLTIRNGETTEM